VQINLLQQLSYILFPRTSEESASLNTYVDATSFDSLKERTKHSKSPAIKTLYIGYPYDGTISSLLDRIKLGREWDVLVELSARFSTRVWIDSEIFIPIPEYIIPIPSDPKRKIKRGFHVADMLAQELAKGARRLGYSSLYLNALMKVKSTNPQSGLTKEQRSKNVKGNYVLRKETGHHLERAEVLWLVDDIVATQSTLGECARVLHKRYPRAQIHALVLSGN